MICPLSHIIKLNMEQLEKKYPLYMLYKELHGSSATIDGYVNMYEKKLERLFENMQNVKNKVVIFDKNTSNEGISSMIR